MNLSALLGTLSKMKVDHSWVIGATVGLPLSILPEWVKHGAWEFHHNFLIITLAVIIGLDWMAGALLAHRAKKITQNCDAAPSSHWNDSMIRNVMILGMCFAARSLDMALDTGSFLYFAVTLAFIHHNLYSLLANVVLLGWEKRFPVGLLRWLDDELEAKARKYFGHSYKNKE